MPTPLPFLLLYAGTTALLVVMTLALAAKPLRAQSENRALFAILLINTLLVIWATAHAFGWAPRAVSAALGLPVQALFFLLPPLLYRYVDAAGRPGLHPWFRWTDALMPILWVAGAGLIRFAASAGYAGDALLPYARLLILNGAFAVYYALAWHRLERVPSNAHRFWLRFGLVLFGLHWLFSAASSAAGLIAAVPAGVAPAMEFLSISCLLVFCGYATWVALREHPGIARQPGRSVETSLSPAELAVLGDRIKRYLADEKPFLNPELSVDDLSRALGVPARHTSQALNAALGGGFFDVINTHRVAEARRMLENPDQQDLTVLEILYAAGFNSKSAFHRAFSKETGMTPTAYRNRALGQTERS
ncbi:MAG: AraC family transcriptional regulator [Rhodothermales bacterium]